MHSHSAGAGRRTRTFATAATATVIVATLAGCGSGKSLGLQPSNGQVNLPDGWFDKLDKEWPKSDGYRADVDYLDSNGECLTGGVADFGRKPAELLAQGFGHTGKTYRYTCEWTGKDARNVTYTTVRTPDATSYSEAVDSVTSPTGLGQAGATPFTHEARGLKVTGYFKHWPSETGSNAYVAMVPDAQHRGVLVVTVLLDRGEETRYTSANFADDLAGYVTK